MDVSVRHHPEESRYEAWVDGALAGFAAYLVQGPVMVFTHTEVDPSYEGKGVGSRLAAGALDGARAGGYRVRPTCPFIRDYVEHHVDAYGDLVGPAR